MGKKIAKEMIKDSKITKMIFIYIFALITIFAFKGILGNNKIEKEIVYVDRYIYVYNDKEVNTNINNDDIVSTVNDKLTSKSNISKDKLDLLLKGTNLEGLSDCILENENKYNINAALITSIIINNSDYGRSERAIINNNLSNMGAYDYNDLGYKYETKEECIEDLYKTLAENYLNPNGMYYEGETIEAISIHFCNDNEWVKSINNLFNNILNNN